MHVTFLGEKCVFSLVKYKFLCLMYLVVETATTIHSRSIFSFYSLELFISFSFAAY